MTTELLKKIVDHDVDSAATIVTHSQTEPHIANTWNSYITITDDEKILIPVGGMTQTEKNLDQNGDILLSITNRVLDGFNAPGIGAVIKGKGKLLSSGNAFELLKKEFSWIRGILVVDIQSIKQTV